MNTSSVKYVQPDGKTKIVSIGFITDTNEEGEEYETLYIKYPSKLKFELCSAISIKAEYVSVYATVTGLAGDFIFTPNAWINILERCKSVHKLKEWKEKLQLKTAA